MSGEGFARGCWEGFQRLGDSGISRSLTPDKRREVQATKLEAASPICTEQSAPRFDLKPCHEFMSKFSGGSSSLRLVPMMSCGCGISGRGAKGISGFKFRVLGFRV